MASEKHASRSADWGARSAAIRAYFESRVGARGVANTSRTQLKNEDLGNGARSRVLTDFGEKTRLGMSTGGVRCQVWVMGHHFVVNDARAMRARRRHARPDGIPRSQGLWC